ncbi:flagellar basal body-associated protein FliL [Aequitasia blattaphilus]|uniref:DUF4366 domain-containing protein n=1 Tax=Aequitasia blattaphilus TaxID=2949332 RepID=A0ABT1E917_9FIRM|nr:DUF4366 domain-containing protein [Aequitasia blattaphilus]MCP1102328.1 DUF4366 domain-containing protein [Aequitasia blattaphilus]MCR8614968.1 DUF4366 domain-containing protein [Aequitasia blattaphilus]
MSKLEDIITATKLSELVNKKDDEKVGKRILWILAIVGAVVAIAGIAYAVYTFFAPDYLEDFEEDFDDDFDDDFFKDDEPETVAVTE